MTSDQMTTNEMSFNKMIWGVKASFRSYVEAAGVTVTLDDGATQEADGAFAFAAQPGWNLSIDADGNATGAIQFQGKVVFEAHAIMLSVTLSELALEASDEGLFLTAPMAPLYQERCSIAKLTPATVGVDGRTFQTEITLDGSYQIADNYPPGTELDPLHLA